MNAKSVPIADIPVEDEVTAVAEHDRGRRRREEVDEWEVEAVQDDGLVVRLAVVLVDRAELLRVLLLAREGLEDAHARDVLLERGGHRAEPLAHAAVGARRAAAEDRSREAHEREDEQRREREPPVEQEEDDDRPEEHQRVLDEALDAVRDELVERFDVVREARDDVPGAAALVVAEREPLQVAEEPFAQVGQDPLADPPGQVRLGHARAPVEEADREERGDDPAEQGQVVLPIPWLIAIFARQDQRGDRPRAAPRSRGTCGPRCRASSVRRGSRSGGPCAPSSSRRPGRRACAVAARPVDPHAVASSRPS